MATPGSPDGRPRTDDVLGRRPRWPRSSRVFRTSVAALARQGMLLLLPAGALALIAGLDAASGNPDDSLLYVGVLDEPAHFATAWLFLAAFLPQRWSTIWRWALVGSVAIDIDHLPALRQLLGGGPDSRPVTHSLATVAVLVLAAIVATSRYRAPLWGLALGTVLHFFRDLTDGPGVALLWPYSSTNFALGRGTYLLVLAVVAGIATLRRGIGMVRRARRTT